MNIDSILERLTCHEIESDQRIRHAFELAGLNSVGNYSDAGVFLALLKTNPSISVMLISTMSF